MLSHGRKLTLDQMDARDFAGVVSHEQERQVAEGFHKLCLFWIETARKRGRGQLRGDWGVRFW